MKRLIGITTLLLLLCISLGYTLKTDAYFSRNFSSESNKMDSLKFEFNSRELNAQDLKDINLENLNTSCELSRYGSYIDIPFKIVDVHKSRKAINLNYIITAKINKDVFEISEDSNEVIPNSWRGLQVELFQVTDYKKPELKSIGIKRIEKEEEYLIFHFDEESINRGTIDIQFENSNFGTVDNYKVYKYKKNESFVLRLTQGMNNSINNPDQVKVNIGVTISQIENMRDNDEVSKEDSND